MSLSIRKVDAQIGIRTTRPQMEYKTEKSQLSIERENPSMEMNIELPKVLIDQYPCRATSGMKNITDLTAQMVSRAKQSVLEYISGKVSDGNALGAIQNKGSNPMAQISAAKLNKQNEFGMVTMPSERPKFDVEGKVEINWNRTWEGPWSGVNFDANPAKIDVNFIRGKVEIYMRQMNKIEFEYTPDNKVDVQV